MTQYQKVREFMEAFGQECPEKPGIPSYETRKLRWKLIAEELDEVHRSNMSKMWTKEKAMARLHADGDIWIRPGYGQSGLVVVVDQKGKIIKSPSYSPANLRPILEGKV